MTVDGTLATLTAGLAEEERTARGTFDPAMEGSECWQLDKFDGIAANVWTRESQPKLVVRHAWSHEAEHVARQDPHATLLRVEAIRKAVIVPYLAAVDDVQESIATLATAKSEYSTASRARINDGGSEFHELRAREALSTAETILAAEVAERDAYAKVIRALAGIYTEPEGS